MGEESVLAHSGWEGEIIAEVGWVRGLNFLSTLRGCLPVVSHVPTIEAPACPNNFPVC